MSKDCIEETEAAGFIHEASTTRMPLPVRHETLPTSMILLENNNNNDSSDRLKNNGSAEKDYSIILLNLVAILWGSQHAVIKTCVSDLDPSSFTMVRFVLGALIATPAWLWASPKNTTTSSKHDLKTTWRWGLEMGFWMFLGYAFQAIGLEVRIS